MSETLKKLLVVAAAVVLVGGWLWYYYRDNAASTSNFPGGIYYICQEKNCGEVFRKTEAELAAFQQDHYGQVMPCPKCGKSHTARGLECPHCKKVAPQRRDVLKCPSCGKDLYSAGS